MEQTELERALGTTITIVRNQFPGLEEPQQEHRFHPVRRWRFDFAWPDLMVAIEAEGGTWTRGRHTRGKGFEDDCEKYNAATASGWHVIRFTRGMVDDGRAFDQMVDMFEYLGVKGST